MRKVETALAALPGVTSARANLSARRVTAVHGATGVNATDLVEALARAGFKAAELAEDAAGPAKPADRELLKRLGVAGFAAANIMLLSVSVWSGGAGDMTPSVQALFHWLSALIALPTVAYAGQPFFRSAAQALRAPPPQHGRADLARRDAGDGHEPLPDGARQRAGLLRRRRHAAVLPAGRSLPRPAHAHARGGRGCQPHGPARHDGHDHPLRRHHRAPRRAPAGARHAHPHRRRRALRRRRPRARRPRRGRREPDHRARRRRARSRRARRSMPAPSTCPARS